MPDALDRTFQSTRRVLGDVDPAQPLDPTSSLTDGLEGFWLPLPRLVGGSRLYDLSANGVHGSFIDAPTWSYDAERGFSHLNFDGSNDAVDISSKNLPLNRYSVFAWIRTNTNGDAGGDGIFSRRTEGFGTFSYNLLLGSSGEIDAGHNDGAGFVTPESTTVVADGSWHYVGVTYDGCLIRIFVDGKVENSASAGTPQNDGEPKQQIGRNPDVDNFFKGNIGAVSLHSRGFGEDDGKRLYDQARRGFPALLRRRDSVSLLRGGGGGTADTVSFNTATALADGFAPTITATANTVSPGTGQAAAQGFSTTVTATQNTVAAGTAQATAQGFEPTITADPNTIAATTGQAAAQGFDPTISEGAAGDTITADLGTAQAQGFTPSITTNPVTVTLGLGQAPANGFDPDVVADPSEINTGQGQAAAIGFDPTVTTNARTVAPQLGTAQADGFEPAVVDGTVGVATTMEIEARPLYEIDVEAKPLYRIRLFVKEQLP